MDAQILAGNPLLACSGCACLLISSPLRPWVSGGTQYDAEAVGCRVASEVSSTPSKESGGGGALDPTKGSRALSGE